MIGLHPLRWALRIGGALVGLLLVYLVVTLGQVIYASRQNQAAPTEAIIVLGAAQYNGRPSPDLKARLDHAYQLWADKLAPLIVVTGGSAPGDNYTEATAAADYLAGRGVPQADLLRETTGRDSWQSLASAARFLEARSIRTVLLVSDPFHDLRISLMAKELGLHPSVSPTATSPIKGTSVVPYYMKETAEVALGRVIGFRRLVGVSERVHKAIGRY